MISRQNSRDVKKKHLQKVLQYKWKSCLQVDQKIVNALNSKVEHFVLRKLMNMFTLRNKGTFIGQQYNHITVYKYTRPALLVI